MKPYHPLTRIGDFCACSSSPLLTPSESPSSTTTSDPHNPLAPSLTIEFSLHNRNTSPIGDNNPLWEQQPKVTKFLQIEETFTETLNFCLHHHTDFWWLLEFNFVWYNSRIFKR